MDDSNTRAELYPRLDQEALSVQASTVKNQIHPHLDSLTVIPPVPADVYLLTVRRANAVASLETKSVIIPISGLVFLNAGAT
jgi:hypothetical protein